MPVKELRGIFPNFAITKQNIKSDNDINNNCVAWALNEKHRWWEPYGVIVPPPPPIFHWPDNLPHDSLPQTYVKFFKTHGFEVTDNCENEEGIEKIAIYIREDEFTHVARQLPNGRWISKLGILEDIEHRLSDLESTPDTDHQFSYGTASIFMRRSRD